MANVHFRLRGKSENESIYLQLTIDRKNRFEKRTGLNISHKDWSKETRLPKQNIAKNKQLNIILRKLETKILDNVNEAQAIGVRINTNWLSHKIDVHFGRINPSGQSEYVTDAIQHIIDTAHLRKNQKGTRGLSKSRINGYRALLRLFIGFQGKRQIKIKEIGLGNGNAFFKYLFDECNYSESYGLRMIGNLKTVCYDAEINGVEVSRQLKKLESGKSRNEYIIYLDPSELELIAKANIKALHLINARKWLLLGCNIGQRGGDLLRITENNIIERRGLRVIELNQQKTGRNVTIPILDTTDEIIESGLPYKISIQKFNKYVKEICKLAGIQHPIPGSLMNAETQRKKVGIYPKYELISSHVCRRSFATNLYGLLPTPLIMQITAHKTEKTFLGYIGKSGMDYAQQIADFYELQKIKSKKEPQLNIVKTLS